METETAERARGAGSGPRLPVVTRSRRWWWLLTVLAVCAALVIGASVQHAVDDRNAASSLYRTQLLTTASRFTDEEQSQISLPAAQRSAAAFGDIADAISADQGVNGLGTLHVSLGAGSSASPAQIAFSATVASPRASTTLVVWYLGTKSSSNEGACVLWSTLLGPGRATATLNLGGGETMRPCEPQWWPSSRSVTMAQPNLSVAGIPQSPS